MNLSNETVIHFAKELGFSLVGFSKANLLTEETRKLEEWLANGYSAKMNYMEKNKDKRLDVKNILPDAKSIISLALNYYTSFEHLKDENIAKVSRYAWGKDYHLVIWEKLEILEDQLKQIEPNFESRSYVDTGPVMDKVWATRSGLGWMGKHSNVINPEIGSWFFIATIITNQEFHYNEVITDHCGTCNKCLEACPTSAIVEPYVVDANKCISYLTIENKGEIAEEYKDKFDNWIFGCDVCQDVCPWNLKFSENTSVHEFYPVNKEFNIEEILQMDLETFKKKFETSPIKRAKLSGIKRNAMFLK